MEGTKIFFPPMFSLSHMATVQIAIKLYEEFSIEVLAEVYRSIQDGAALASEDSEKYPGYNMAREKFLLVPLHLGKSVMEAIHGLDSGVEQWKKDHSELLELDEIEYILYWRCDGTIDTVKTAQQLAMNSSIEIRKRFRLACVYCFEETIQELWLDMQATGKAENLETVDCTIVRFWVEWLRGRHPGPWKKRILYEMQVTHPVVKFKSFFTSLESKTKDLFLFLLTLSSPDDLRLCLYMTSKEEEDRLCERNPITVLRTYLHWPMRSMYIETAKKMWKYINCSKYCYILDNLLSIQVNKDVFDLYCFFECFWNESPSDCRKTAMESPELAKKIELCFTELEKRKNKMS